MATYKQHEAGSVEAVVEFATRLLTDTEIDAALLGTPMDTKDKFVEVFQTTPIDFHRKYHRRGASLHVEVDHYVDLALDPERPSANLTVGKHESVLALDIHEWTLAGFGPGSILYYSDGAWVVRNRKDELLARLIHQDDQLQFLLEAGVPKDTNWGLSLNVTVYKLEMSIAQQNFNRRMKEKSMSRVPFETLNYIGRNAVSKHLGSVMLTPEEEAAFEKTYGISTNDLMRKLARTGRNYKAQQVPFDVSLDSILPIAGLTEDEALAISVSLSRPIDVTLADGSTMQLEPRSQYANEATLVNPAVSEVEMVGGMRHDDHNIEVHITEAITGGKNATIRVRGLVTQLAPIDNKGYTEKERKHAMSPKPDSLKKSSVARHAERASTFAHPVNWSAQPPSLIVGKSRIVVFVAGASDEDLRKLSSEWYWHEARNAHLPENHLSLALALANQDELLALAKSFIGVHVYLAKTKDKTYVLPIREDDDMALTALLDRGFWSKSEVVYPSKLEDWNYGPDRDDYVVIEGLRKALLLQGHASLLREQEAAEKEAGTGRKSTAKKAPARKTASNSTRPPRKRQTPTSKKPDAVKPSKPVRRASSKSVS